MCTLKESVLSFMKAHEMRYLQLDEEGEFYEVMNVGEHAQWRVILLLEETEGTIISRFPAHAAPKRRPECAALLHRLNFGGKLGCFELDMDDGEIRFRSPLLPAPQKEHTDPLIAAAFAFNFQTVDQHVPVIMAVLFGNTTAVKALKTLEKTEPHPSVRLELN